MVDFRIGKCFQLLGGDEKRFFQEKYGTTNPIARIDKKFHLNLENIESFEDYVHESYQRKLDGYLQAISVHNYWIRAKYENLPLQGVFYYCHIQNIGEVIHEAEIGEEVSQGQYQFSKPSENVSARSVYISSS